jgi:hypothetical protein
MVTNLVTKMKTSKKFLFPLATALAALTSSAVASKLPKNLHESSYINEAANSQTSNINKPLGDAYKLLSVQREDELHDLILYKNQNGVILAGHHSHRSHSSHRSHYSSR